MNKLVKIVLTGPESVGKSTLVKQLSDHFEAAFCDELARDYVENLGREYAEEDVHQIANLQIAQELKCKNHQGLHFFDTDLIVTRVWLERVYNHVPEWLDEHLRNEPASIHILCYPDLPWEYDFVRENPDNRVELFDDYKSEITRLGIPYSIIKGKNEERLKNAIQAINEFLNYK